MKRIQGNLDELFKNLEAKEKIIKVLMDRVEKSLDTGTDAFSIMQSNIQLEKKVEERTRELEAQSERMKILAIQADEANKAKSEFLANMSHEIRTPMHAILGYIELLKEKAFDNEAKDYLDIIANSSTHLLNIINDILDYSKAEAGKINLDPQSINIKREAQSFAKLFDISCKTKEIHFHISIDPSIPDWVEIDGFRLRQVLNNLLSNAIKFTESGKNIYFKILKKDNLIEFIVKDEGIGIAADAIDNIFKAFTQAESSTTREFGGTGLGLAISSKLVELLGGELKVESEEEKGSKFYFSIPIIQAYAPREVYSSQTTIKADEGYNILIVEDNPTNQKLLGAYLDRLGYSYEIVSNGQQCLDAIDSMSFDLILMDENMPVLNGIATTEEIRKRESASNGRKNIIIALTANAMTGDRERFLGAGMDEYLSKPVSKGDLSNMLKRFLP